MSEFKWKDLVGEYIELRNSYDFTVMENKNLWEQIAQHTRTIADYEKRLQEQENETIAVRDQRDAVKRELEQLKLNINNQPTAADFEAISGSYDELLDDYNSVVDDYNDSQSYIIKLKNKLSAAENEILGLRHEALKKDKKIVELQDAVAILKLDIKTNEEIAGDAISEKDDLIKNREYERDLLYREVKDYEEKLKSYENEEDKRQKEIADYQAQIKELKDENEYLKTQSAIYGDDDDLPWI